MCGRRGEAVGLVYAPVEVANTRELELTVSLRMAQEGYADAQVFVLNGTPSDADMLIVAEQFAERIEAQAVFVTGRGDRETIEELAARARLVVFDVDRVGQSSR